MFALLGFVAGIAIGAAGAVSWLLGKPAPRGDAELPQQSPVAEIRQAVEEAVQQGKIAGAEAERRKRQEFEAAVHRPS